MWIRLQPGERSSPATDASSVGYKENDPALPHCISRSKSESVRFRVYAPQATPCLPITRKLNNTVWVQGYAVDKDNNVKHNVVGTHYFATMGIPLLEGRTFGSQDTATSPQVAVISETMARTMFPRALRLGGTTAGSVRSTPETRK